MPLLYHSLQFSPGDRLSNEWEENMHVKVISKYYMMNSVRVYCYLTICEYLIAATKRLGEDVIR
jgi:hypothetical protein